MRHDDYDKQLRAMLAILKNDYAGLALGGKVVDGWYYMQVASMAWTEGKLDDLLFSAMAARCWPRRWTGACALC